MIRERLNRTGGHITENMMEDFKKEFGDDFPVVAELSSGSREVVAVCDLKSFAENYLDETVEDVFISGKDFERIF